MVGPQALLQTCADALLECGFADGLQCGVGEMLQRAPCGDSFYGLHQMINYAGANGGSSYTSFSNFKLQSVWPPQSTLP